MLRWNVIAIPMVIYAASLGTYFISQAILGRTLANAELGIFAAQYGTAMILSSLMTWGLDIAALKFASVYYLRGEKNEFLRFIRVGTISVVATAIPVATVVWTLFPLWSSNEATPSPSFLAALVIWSFAKFFASILRAVGWTSLSLIVDRVIRDGTIAILAMYWLYIDYQGPKLDYLNIALLLGVSIGFVVAGLVVWKEARRMPTKKSQSSVAILAWLTTSLTLWCVNLSEMIFSRSEVVAFYWSGRFADAGVLSILATASGIAILPLLALNVVFQPKISAAADARDLTSLHAHIKKFTWLGVAGTWIFGAIVLFSPSELVRTFGLSSPNAEHLMCLRVLVASRMVLAPIGPVVSILLMTGGQAKFLVVYGSILCAKLSILYFYAETMDLLSVAVLTSAFLAVIQISGAFLLYRQYGNVFGIAKHDQ